MDEDVEMVDVTVEDARYLIRRRQRLPRADSLREQPKVGKVHHIFTNRKNKRYSMSITPLGGINCFHYPSSFEIYTRIL